MKRVLVVFAHPALEKSRVNRRLLQVLPDLPGVTLDDLYERYPDFDVDVKREQALMEQHDIILLHHPFYWYSVPALLKQWIDLVLEHGWAYGTGGTALKGKWMVNAVTAGGGADAYRGGGPGGFTVRSMLAPMEHTALLCGMRYLPPFVIYGTHRLQAPELERCAADYASMVESLRDERVNLDAAADAADFPLAAS